jgi:hypothetical protein
MLRDFLAGQGILAQLSCPDADPNKGVVECNHRHLHEMTRAMMIAASLPTHVWAEIILVSTYHHSAIRCLVG